MVNEIERARSALWSLDPGTDRESWVRHGMGAKAAGLLFDDFNDWSAGAGNYKNEAECRSVWNSIKDGGVTAASLFRSALAGGWQDPSKPPTKANGTPRPQPIAKPTTTQPKAVKSPQGMNPVEVRALGVAADVSDAYVHRKGGKPDGLKIYPASAPPLVIRGQNVAGSLMVPCWDGADLKTLQFIPPDGGDKLNLPGASFGSGFFTVGEVTDRAYICEGIGQAWACNTATGAAAVVCFGAGRMATVSKVLREKFPAASLVIVPDRGKEVQAATIAAAVNGSWIEMPAAKPTNYDCNDYASEYGTEALAALLERPQGPPMRYRLLTDTDLCKLPPMQWRVKGVLPAEGLGAVFGASGSGKSFLVLDMLQSLAGGADWFGHRVTPCHVIYCALEGEGGIAGRVNAYRIRHGATSENIRYLVQPFSLLDGGDIHDLATAIKAGKNNTNVVVLDTLNRAAPGADENDSKAMGLIIAAAKELQTLIGGLVLLVHHTGKDASKGLRGHSSLHAALDAAVEVRRDGERREWLIAKSKDGEDGAAHPFKLDVVELGTDQDGEPVTSCVIHPQEEVADNIRRILPPKSGNLKIAWDALGEALRKAGDVKPEGAPDALPKGRPCLTVESTLTVIGSRLAVEPKRRTERARLALTGLCSKGMVTLQDGFLWLP